MSFSSSHLGGRQLPLLLLLMAGSAMAQVYRNVDKNGVVSYSDQPPSRAAQPAAPRGGTVNELPEPVGSGSLPYELRQVVQRYPVTLYTGDDCQPCSAARSMLTTRGVPFSERTVKTNEDVAALQRLSGQNTLPVVSIGTQQLKGYSDVEWSQYLDAAGYPKSNQLSAGYARPPAQPLVAVKEAPAPAARPPAAASVPVAPAPAAVSGPTPDNPAGIKF
ncbi:MULTISPECIES: glutaredoxin family protein [unclassified Variovorax]|uniref:glutaredoxin family protein n=1 Tax=unclassified Variovorax TaxID=663243 RepID=UPI001BD51BD7|nr:MULTISPECIES: glutaredoxin family protein [unclassified Variovorax]